MRILFRLLLCLPLLFPTLALAGHGKDAAPGKPAILIVAFGSSVPRAQETIQKMVEGIQAAHPDQTVRLAYSSNMIRRKLATQGQQIDSPLMALARLAGEGADKVAVQPLQVLPGEEFHDIVAQAQALQGLPKGLSRVAVGQPLLGGNPDLAAMAGALAESAAPLAKDEVLLLVGHGTRHGADAFYPALQEHFRRLGNHQGANVLVGTIEGTVGLEDVLAELKARKIRKVRLRPLLGVAGDHVVNDILGDAPDSWKSRLQAAGLSVTPVPQGLLDLPAAVALWTAHLETALATLQ